MHDDKIDILLVDDRDENLLALETVLYAPDLNLVKATSGKEALRYLLHHEPALILMDVQMPDLDGFETTRLIKNSERTRDIPTIFVTAINQDERYIHQGYEHGAVDYINKPYDAYILKSKVSVFVDLARKNKRLIKLEKQEREAERKEREQQIIHLELKSLKREQTEQKKYLDLVDGISHGIVWSADAQSLVMSFISPSAESILGYSLDQWSSEKQFFLEHIPHGDREKMLNALRELKATGKSLELDHRFTTASGKEVWLHTGLRLAQKSEEVGAEIRGLSIEITKTKEAESLLQLNKKHSDFLAEASLLLATSLEYKETLPGLANLVVNSRIADWFAIYIHGEDESLKPLLVHRRNSAKTPNVREALSSYQDHLNNEVMFCSEISDEILSKLAQTNEQLELFRSLKIKSAISVPLTSHEKVYGVMILLNAESGYIYTQNDLLMVQDLARRTTISFDNSKFYRQAQMAIQVRDEFLSIASHELKTPLTPLKLQIQMLMRLLKSGSLTDIKTDKLDKILQTSDRQLDRLSSLIDELLDVTKINQGKLRLTLQEFDLVLVIRELVERFNGSLQGSTCEVKTDLPENLWVLWDRFRIEQVLINLLSNSIKYGQDLPIHLSIQVEEERVKIKIKDQGIGIAKKDQQRIFERFERAVSANNFSGLGLGLYIVSKALEAHLGNIEIESELGKGSTFTLSLPKRAVDTPADAQFWKNPSISEVSL